MSRSRKHSPCITWCGRTNKKSKRFCKRKFRRKSKIRMLGEREPLYSLNEAMTTYSFNTDGLAIWHNNLDKKFLRK